MIYIGIDPGVTGGIATIDSNGVVLAAVKMPDLNHELLAALTRWQEAGHWRAVLEKVNAGVFAGFGGRKKAQSMGVVSAFTFGKGVGRLEMALDAARIPFDEVAPIRWQNVMGCRTGGDKNVTKRRAAQLFPGVTVTHAIADALILAEYCRRLDKGQIVNK